MGFIPEDEDVQPIVVALEGALPNVLDAPVGELNFKNVINKLGDIMYEFPFSLPPFYIAIIRCLGVLEGLAIQVDRDFRIISDAYPYIASRLLTDTSPELQSALEKLLFKEGKPRWERLEQLLSEASETTDYDVMQAVDKLLDYLVSPAGSPILDQLVLEIIEGMDELGEESRHLFIESLAQGRVPSPQDVSSPRLATASRVAEVISRSGGVGGLDRDQLVDQLTPVLNRLATNPVTQQAGIDIATAVSERAVTRTIRWIFDLPETTAAASAAAAAARR